MRMQTLFERDDLPRYAMPEALRRRYNGDIGFGGSTLYANFVSSIDGVVSLEGGTSPSVIGQKSKADKFVMGLLRACAEALVVGAGTLRAEPKHLWTPESISPDMAEQYRELRQSLGLSVSPQLVILTKSGDIEPTLPSMERGPLVITTKSAAERLRRKMPAAASVVAPDEDELKIEAVVKVLRGEGYRVILTEGGPSVMTQFLEAAAVDQLFLTLSPVLAGREKGRERSSLVEGFAFEPDLLGRASLLSAKRDGSHLFLRYELSGTERSGDVMQLGSARLSGR